MTTTLKAIVAILLVAVPIYWCGKQDEASKEFLLVLGPVQVTSENVIQSTPRIGSDGRVQIQLSLTDDVATMLEDFSTQAVGQNMEIWVDGELINQVRIAEPIEGNSIILVLSQEHAARLQQALFANN